VQPCDSQSWSIKLPTWVWVHAPSDCHSLSIKVSTLSWMAVTGSHGRWVSITIQSSAQKFGFKPKVQKFTSWVSVTFPEANRRRRRRRLSHDVSSMPTDSMPTSATNLLQLRLTLKHKLWNTYYLKSIAVDDCMNCSWELWVISILLQDGFYKFFELKGWVMVREWMLMDLIVLYEMPWSAQQQPTATMISSSQ